LKAAANAHLDGNRSSDSYALKRRKGIFLIADKPFVFKQKSTLLGSMFGSGTQINFCFTLGTEAHLARAEARS
jgi:hypothetical protein